MAKTTETSVSSTLPILLRVSLRMFFAFIQASDIDTPAAKAALETLASALASLPALALYLEDSESTEALEKWLISAAHENADARAAMLAVCANEYYCCCCLVYYCCEWTYSCCVQIRYYDVFCRYLLITLPLYVQYCTVYG